MWFSSERKPSVGAYVDGEMIKYTDGTNDYDMLNVHDMNLLFNTASEWKRDKMGEWDYINNKDGVNKV